jgi:ribonuclease P protein subunit POP4
LTGINERNIISHELIGLEVEVTRDRNPYNINMRGRVVDETRNTLLVNVNGKIKRIIKKGTTLRFFLSKDKIVEIDGGILVSRPEDRIKKRIKRGW